MNKRGFTPEQQEELERIIGICTRTARLTTESVIGTNEQIAEALKELLVYVRIGYPKGPLHLAEALKNICEFCDLPTIITTDYQHVQNREELE